MKPIVILAGGLGTRLRSVVSDLPKPLAPVAGKPFLWWLLRSLEQQGAEDVYLSTGYKAELVRETFGDHFGRVRLHYSVEDEPLGTGGAVLRAAQGIAGNEFFVFNGDTIATLDIAAMEQAALDARADVMMSVVQVQDASRYGTIEFNAQHRVTAFKSKGSPGAGHISAGIYLLKKDVLEAAGLPHKFSLEQEYFERQLSALQIVAFPGVGQFIDIGIPEDYSLAQDAIPRWINAA